MMNNLKAKLFELPTGRINQQDEAYTQELFGWVVDFSPDNVVNTAFRKEELLDFALFNEGNVYNKLFYKVECTYFKCLHFYISFSIVSLLCITVFHFMNEGR